LYVVEAGHDHSGAFGCDVLHFAGALHRVNRSGLSCIPKHHPEIVVVMVVAAVVMIMMMMMTIMLPVIKATRHEQIHIRPPSHRLNRSVMLRNGRRLHTVQFQLINWGGLCDLYCSIGQRASCCHVITTAGEERLAVAVPIHAQNGRVAVRGSCSNVVEGAVVLLLIQSHLPVPVGCGDELAAAL
jgi:hypothetical protein